MGTTEHRLSDDKATPIYGNEKTPTVGSDAELGEHNIEGHIELVETTKRGLKARHAQMIALGGTIGLWNLQLHQLKYLTEIRYRSFRWKWRNSPSRRSVVHPHRLYNTQYLGSLRRHSHH